MAKNTSSSAFRKIDVDEFNEDNYKEDELGAGNEIRINESEINQLQMQGRHAEALVYCLKNAPLGSKSQDVKDSAAAATLRVLLSIKQSQMDDCISVLDADQVDTLMKYIYKGFENPNESGSSGHLLAWHDKAFGVGGIGSITRVLTDRRRV